MRAVRVVVGVALLVVVVVLLFVVLNWYVGPKTPSVRKDLVVAVAQILGGTALLSGLYFTWRTLQVNREGQITERFTRAIDQLGKVEDGQKLFEIRIGGIYALERIARESEEDYWPIMEVLTTYVRQNTSRITKEGQEVTDDATEKQSAMDSSGEESGAIEPPAPDPDIQVIMTVLGRHTRFFEPGEPAKMILDLHNANLSRVDLREADLFGVNLRGADLSYANLSNAVLRANLSHADLRRADLSYVTVIQAEGLCEADLRGADLSYADLRRAEGITAEQLQQQAKCLKGAIMPDGSRHP